MRQARRAVIDIGTNSVKLLVGEVSTGQVRPVWEESEQTRLGSGFYETQQLQASAIEQTAKAVARFTERARELSAAEVRLIATSAARDAINKDALLEAIQTACGLRPEVISGDQEAEWVFQGVGSTVRFHGRKLMILDVGGGSMEIVLGEEDHHSFCQSFALGSVRLLEKIPPSDPPTTEDLAKCRGSLRDFFKHEIARAIEARLHERDRKEIQLVGTGGTATILARMERHMVGFDRELIEEVCLTREQVSHWMEKLWSIGLAERKRIVGLPPNRADIILFGVAIYEAVMEHFEFPTMFVSTRGLRFGALLAATSEEKT
jgi:exopolyphosphatase/guanosine-5'-triphosphate,3'-diphosphate pyrophosphatase